MSDTMKGLKRTIMNGHIAEKNIGDTVVLTGWVAKARNLGSLIFVDLRDRTGIVQLVFDSTVDEDVFNKAEKIRNEYVLCVKGVVRPREKEAINTKMATGMVEVYVNDLRILSEAETPPIHVDDKAVTGEVNRLKYRYLDLRKPSIQKNLILRHEVARYARNFFADNGFLEIETPMLSKSTPEGARDYLVPSRIHHGKFYALPQSPQLYKQLLMVAGFDRYIQIVKCFRDEDLRADRQPEFTQIDLEMSFVDMDDVVSINEEFLKGLFKKVMDVDVEIPFRRMSYKEAMDKYGTDKPDTRFGMELKDISSFAENCSFGIFKDTVKNGGCVKLISASGAGSFSRKEIDKLVEFVKFHGGKGMAWIINGENETRSSLGKVLTEEEIKEIIRLAESNVGDLI